MAEHALEVLDERSAVHCEEELRRGCGERRWREHETLRALSTVRASSKRLRIFRLSDVALPNVPPVCRSLADHVLAGVTANLAAGPTQFESNSISAELGPSAGNPAPNLAEFCSTSATIGANLADFEP